MPEPARTGVGVCVCVCVCGRACAHGPLLPTLTSPLPLSVLSQGRGCADASLRAAVDG
jgi:hypothetical protein